MRSLMILGAAASMLVLAGCNRDTETAPAADDAATSAMSADSAGSDAATSASASGGAGGGAPAAASAGETMDPASAASTVAPSTVGPVTQDTRDSAKMAAEETNLHPKPPAN